MSSHPTLQVRVPRQPVRGIAVILHGGQSHSTRPTRPWQLSVLRMVPFARSLAAHGPGLAVASLRYRVRGWNGFAQASLQDARWGLARLAERFPDTPMAVIGHSLGGRTALRVADDPHVRAVAALAPWLPPDEPIGDVRDRRILIAHGTADRMTDPRGSAAYALRARAAGAEVSFVSVAGEHHAMLRRPRFWHELTTGFVLGALGEATKRLPGDLDVTEAVRRALAGEPRFVV